MKSIIKKNKFITILIGYKLIIRGVIIMKKFSYLLLFIFIFTIGYSTTLSAESIKNKILIRTIDNTEAIKIFKNKLNDDWGMLTRNGFGVGSSIGTPFSVEFQERYDGTDRYPTKSPDGINIYLFYFPIIRDGEIVTYIEQTVKENGTVSWATAKWFSDESDLTQLSNGKAYALITDKTINKIAISDNDVVILESDPDYPVDYNVPYEGKETYTVNIMEPIDIDTSFLIPQTEEEKAIFENARKNGKTIISQNADELGAINKNSRLLVPLRSIAELIGCTVDWDNNAKAAYAKKNDNTVKFVIGKTEYSVNDKVYNLDVPAEIYNDKTFIPLRAVSESLGASITYNSTTKKITLS